MHFEADKVERNVQQATTTELLDRVTIYRSDMEPEAIPLIERELARRGVLPNDVDKHAEEREQSGLVRDAAGMVRICVRCGEPAVEVRWSWQKLFKLVPVFPRPQAFCALHR